MTPELCLVWLQIQNQYNQVQESEKIQRLAAWDGKPEVQWRALSCSLESQEGS